jgi:hypothetical protein
MRYGVECRGLLRFWGLAMAKFTPSLILSALTAVTNDVPPKGSTIENDVILDVVDHLSAQLDFPNDEHLYRIVRAHLGEHYSIVKCPPIRWWHTLNAIDHVCAQRRSSFRFMSEGGRPAASIHEIASELRNHFPEYETKDLEPIIRRHLMRKATHVVVEMHGDTAWYATKPPDEMRRPE